MLFDFCLRIQTSMKLQHWLLGLKKLIASVLVWIIYFLTIANSYNSHQNLFEKQCFFDVWKIAAYYFIALKFNSEIFKDL